MSTTLRLPGHRRRREHLDRRSAGPAPRLGHGFLLRQDECRQGPGVEGHQPRADAGAARRRRHRAGLPDRRPVRAPRPPRLLPHALRDRREGRGEVPEALPRPGGHRPLHRHEGRAGTGARREEPGLHRRPLLPALVRAGARPRQGLPLLYQVLRARHPDPDAGGPVDDLRARLPLPERRPPDHPRRRRLRLPRTEAARHPRGHPLARRDDRHGLEARQRVHRLRRPPAQVLAGELQALTSTPRARTRSSSAPTSPCCPSPAPCRTSTNSASSPRCGGS